MIQMLSPVETQAIHWPSVIRHYRLSKGLKQAALAHDLGVTQTMVSRWESGAAMPSHRIQEKVFQLYWRAQVSVSREAWLQRIGQHPALIGVIDDSGRMHRVSRGFQRILKCRRHDLEGRFVQEAFQGDLVDLFDTLTTSGFFEGRVASAESMDRFEFHGADGRVRTLLGHGLHRPTFLPGPQIVWLLSGAEVSPSVFRDVRSCIGGARVIRKAI